jgi:plasmid stabilization system protein ParE
LRKLQADFEPIALAEAESAKAWYFELSPVLAEAFVDDLEKTKNLAVVFPGLGKVVNEVLRSFPLSRFPYYIVYLLKRNRIRIVAVAHERRGPRYLSGLKHR